MVQCLTASFLLMVLSSPVLIVTVISASLVMAPVIATQRWVLELAVLLSQAKTFKQSPPAMVLQKYFWEMCILTSCSKHTLLKRTTQIFNLLL